MTDILCPMCGKPNSPDREVCQYCEARLVPLIAESPPQEEIPSQSVDEPTPEIEPSDQEETRSDWLSDLRSENDDISPSLEIDEEEPISDIEASGMEAESPDWLLRLDGSSIEPEQLDSTDQPGELDSGVSEISDDEGTPEWLREISQESEDMPEEISESTQDWLSRLGSEATDEEQTELEGEELDLDWSLEDSSDEEEIPDWLQQVNSPESETEVGETESEQEQLPDWLMEGYEESSSREEDSPDWLEQVAGEPEEPAVSEMTPEWLSEITEEEVDEQLDLGPRTMDRGGEEEIELEAAQAFEPEPEEAEIPDWMKGEVVETEESPPVPFIPQDQEEQNEFIPESFPSDWIPEEIFEDTTQEEEPGEPEISRAEIPSWLESMRPVEDAAPSAPLEEEPEGQVERAGPLAGLSGLLSVQPEVSRVQEPSAYSVKLDVSENQNTHANILKAMLAEEGKPQSIERAVQISPQHLLRSVIGLVLILALLWPIFTNSRRTPLPTFSASTAAVNQLINQLPGQARVLVSFDYEPGFSGEMDATASPIIDHLMLRGAYLTIVSTSPMGPVVGERFIATTQTEHAYISGEQYINLGYIPGGPAGLLSFAESPQRTLPYTLNSIQAWSGNGGQPLPPLQGVQHLADFSMVMVVTDNPVVARAWVEQVQPFLENQGTNTPLVMVTSAQVEPLVRPYYQASASQVQGLISGLHDGGAYALLTGRGGLPRKYWDAFSFGLLIAGILIVLGGATNIALRLLERSRKEG